MTAIVVLVAYVWIVGKIGAVVGFGRLDDGDGR